MSIAINTNWIRSSAAFKTVKSGNYNDPTVWEALGEDGEWYSVPFIPEKGNDIYIESTHTVTLTENHECKTINYINGEDKVSINTGDFTLNIYGHLRRYTGSAPGTSATIGGGIGSVQWLTGNFTFRGKTRDLPSVGYPSSFNLYGSNFTVDLDEGERLTILDLIGSVAYTLGGTFIVKSGSTFSTGNAQFRVANTPANISNADGDIIVESGAKIITARLTPGGVVMGRGVSMGFNSFTLQEGAIFESISNAAIYRISAASHDMSGEVHLSLKGDQSFPSGSNTTPPGIVPILIYNEIYLSKSGAKTLVNDITINGKLSFNSTPTLNKSTFSLTYGDECDLEYLSSRTKGVELPASGSGSAIPRNLILPGAGVTLDLNGETINIRGVLVGDGSVTNGTLNENQS